MITVNGLTKKYAHTTAVDQISFEVQRGQIVGFLGPNGAGKTTTMRMLTCFLTPTGGTATVAGFDILEQPLEVKKRIGYLPETPPVYPEMRIAEYLDIRRAAQRAQGIGLARAGRLRLRAVRGRRRSKQDHRETFERLPAARGPGPGDHPQSRTC